MNKPTTWEEFNDWVADQNRDYDDQVDALTERFYSCVITPALRTRFIVERTEIDNQKKELMEYVSRMTLAFQDGDDFLIAVLRCK